MKQILVNSRSRTIEDASELVILMKHLHMHKPHTRISSQVMKGQDTWLREYSYQSYGLPDRPIDLNTFHKVVEVKLEKMGLREAHIAIEDNVPALRVTRFLKKNKINLDPTLFNYKMKPQKNLIVAQHLHKLPKGPKVCVQKGILPPGCFRTMMKNITNNGYIPVVIDWNDEWPKTNKKGSYTVWGHKCEGDFGTIASMIAQCELFIGKYTGPIYLASAVGTQSICFWENHHPIHHFGFCNNTTHLLPRLHRKVKLHSTNKEMLIRIFEKNYTHTYYKDLETTLLNTIYQKLELKLKAKPETRLVIRE